MLFFKENLCFRYKPPVTYKPPKTNIDSYSDVFTELLDKLHDPKNCYIAGDFNIDLLKSDSNVETNAFVDTLLSYSFFPTITKPTRITRESATLIDNIYTNAFDQSINNVNGILYTDISDHLPIFIIHYETEHKHRPEKYLKCIYSAQSADKFREDISRVDWSVIYDLNNPNEQYNLMIDIITEIYDKHFPIKTFSVKPSTRNNPWITPGILKSIKRKNKLYRAKLQNYNEKNREAFRNHRNKLNHLIRFTKKEYYNKLIIKAHGNLKAIWEIINEIMNKRRKQIKCPSSIVYNEKYFDSKFDIANIFNRFFTNVGPSLAKKLSPSKLIFDNWMKKVSPTPDLIFQFVSPLKVLDQLYSLDCTKSAGHDGIKVKYLIMIAELIYQPLSHIFNTSIITSTFPDMMKIAKIIPSFKGGDNSTVSNYRPISLLPVFSKVFEKIVCELLTEHLEDNNLLFNYQFGFRKNRNTTYAILDCVNRIIESIDNGNFSIGIFLDLSKAFDSIDHDLLLRKLPYYGINNGTKAWFESYLKNRRQYVSIDGIESDQLRITHGVPQGSILGPILFLIFVNDAQYASRLVHLILYADDMNLFYNHKCMTTILKVLKRELDSLEDWLLANKLTVNLSKTNFILFGSIQRLKGLEQTPILKIMDKAINRVSSTKFLGVIIDQNLSWDSHIDFISRKIAKSIGILYRARHLLNLDILKNLYYNLIYPYVSYATLTWGSNYKSKLNRIHVLQKRALRVITFADRRAPSRPLFRKLDMLNVYEIVNLQLGELVFRHTNNCLPEIFF